MQEEPPQHDVEDFSDTETDVDDNANGSDDDQEDQGDDEARYAFAVVAFMADLRADAVERDILNLPIIEDLFTNMLRFEGPGFGQIRTPAPITVQWVQTWTQQRSLPRTFGEEVVEPHLARSLAQTLLAIRGTPVTIARTMTGRSGLIGVVRGLYEASIANPPGAADFNIMFRDLARTATVLRDPRMDGGTVLEALTQENPEQTTQATAVLTQVADEA